MPRLRVLTLTTLYPNAVMPAHGVFVENRLRHLVDRHDIELQVIAPVPFFPFKSDVFGRYAAYAKTPRQETRHGIEVYHPRYLAVPKVGMTYSARSLFGCFKREIERICASGWDFDLIDAHYFYPDGVAAAKIADELNKPLAITARGTDINLIPSYPRQHEMILEATAIADASITVCDALRDEMIRLGAAAEKITVLRNGVDLGLFKALDRVSIRKSMDLHGPVLLSVGHLIDRKGHDLVIEALDQLEDTTLLIAGTGPEESALKKLAQELGVAGRTRFLGAVPHSSLPELYNAADILVLASSREGWPNVLLEAMACGTPCVATPVWGTREVVTSPESGLLSDDLSVDALSSAIRTLQNQLPPRDQTRAYAEKFSWDDTSDGLNALFSQIVESKKQKQQRNSSHADWRVDRAIEFAWPQPRLLVTVDTEEVFEWNCPDFSAHSLAPIADISRFQAVCERNGFRPLYFVTWPLMKDQETAAFFRNLHQAGKADLGLHLHQWVTPPEASENTPYTSYQCNLSAAEHEQKLDALIEAFKQAFGLNPVAHRAGRYGVSPSVHDQLLAKGVYLDFSPSTAFDHSADGGPDFSGVTNHPWSRVKSGDDEPLMCIPVTGGRSLTHTRFVIPQSAERTGNFLPLSGIVKKFTAPLRLTPEAFDTRDLQALTNSVVKDGIRLLTYSLHSTSLTLGATPYSQKSEDVEMLLGKTDQYLSWFNSEIGKPAALDDILNNQQRSH